MPNAEDCKVQSFGTYDAGHKQFRDASCDVMLMVTPDGNEAAPSGAGLQPWPQLFFGAPIPNGELRIPFVNLLLKSPAFTALGRSLVNLLGF